MLIDHLPRPEQRILGEHTRGMCNRMRALASAWHVAKSYRGEDAIDEVKLLWPPTHGVLAVPFHSLFENDILSTRQPNDFVFRNWRLFLTKEEQKKHKVKEIDMIYEGVPHPLREAYISHFRRLRPKQQIMDCATNFSSSYINDTTIGVHIRTWQEGRRRDLFHFDRYPKIVKKLLRRRPDANVFCCSDRKRVLEQMQSIFGKRLLIYNTRKLTGPCNHQLALTELLILSKCNTIVTNEITSFGEMAWWLGGCEAQVYRARS